MNRNFEKGKTTIYSKESDHSKRIYDQLKIQDENIKLILLRLEQQDYFNQELYKRLGLKNMPRMNQPNPSTNSTETSENEIVEESLSDGEVVEINETNLNTEQLGRYFRMGDQIEINVKGNIMRGVFILFEREYIVWVNQKGELTFTVMKGISISKVSIDQNNNRLRNML